MSLLYIEEYDTTALGLRGGVMAAQQPPVAVQIVDYSSGSAVQSAAFGVNTRFVRLHCDVPCSRLFGDNPTALVTSGRMAAGDTEYSGVTPGSKVSVISNA